MGFYGQSALLHESESDTPKSPQGVDPAGGLSKKGIYSARSFNFCLWNKILLWSWWRLNFTLGFRTVGHFSCRVISVERCLSFPVWPWARSSLFLRRFSPCLPAQILGRRPSLVAFVLRAYQSLWHSGYFTDEGSCSCYSSVVPLSHTPAPMTILRLWIHIPAPATILKLWILKEWMDKAVCQRWHPNVKEAYLKWSLSTLSPSFNIN